MLGLVSLTAPSRACASVTAGKPPSPKSLRFDPTLARNTQDRPAFGVICKCSPGTPPTANKAFRLLPGWARRFTSSALSSLATFGISLTPHYTPQKKCSWMHGIVQGCKRQVVQICYKTVSCLVVSCCNASPCISSMAATSSAISFSQIQK